MELDPKNFSQEFQNSLKFLGITIGIAVILVGIGNILTPSEPPEVGMVELDTECVGLEAGICFGLQTPDHTTYNFDDYETAEEGTDNYYRLVESELMIQAYNICGEETSGMEWISEAEYEGQTGDEWLENEEVELLPCEQTTFYSIDD